MRCDSPVKVLEAGTRSKIGKVYNRSVEVRCGKCYPCRIYRLRGWIFRLRQEQKVSNMSYFVTLTYDPAYVPITKNGFMTLCKKDVQKYMKILRNQYRYKEGKKYMYDRVPDIKYYAVGEYGSKRGRPHYHIIIFNAHENFIVDSWTKGNVVVGTVTEASVAYTLTYMITKSAISKQHARDDRLEEFQLMSKGLGESYVTDLVYKAYKSDPFRFYILQEDGTKIGMPRYYRNMIYTDRDRSRQAHYAQIIQERIEERDRRTEQQKVIAKLARSKKIRNVKH